MNSILIIYLIVVLLTIVEGYLFDNDIEPKWLFAVVAVFWPILLPIAFIWFIYSFFRKCIWFIYSVFRK